MSLQNKRIYLVEDGVENRAIIQTLLERSGAKIAFDRWGTDTIKGLQLFAPVDIILLDLMLPNKVTGYDVFDRIREIADFVDVPIVAVSAADPSEAVPKTRAKGFAGFIAKPIDFELFPLQIERILNHESVWQLR
ncbi:MAG: response regulator [Burkholderiales bacterium]|nr:response regulator [Anaerolineae bacterium]